MLGAASGLAAGMMIAAISFQIRDLAQTETPTAIVFYFSLFGALVLLPMQPFEMTPHTGYQWLLLIGLGMFGTIGQLLLTGALRFGAVTSVVVMDYTALIWTTLYGWRVFNQLPPATIWLGAPLIVAAGLVLAWQEHRKASAASHAKSRHNQATLADLSVTLSDS